MSQLLADNLRLHESFRSKVLHNERDVIVWLPPEYGCAPDRRYRVLYLQDGQNLFDPATAFAGNDWALGQTAQELICCAEVQPLIIVGIYNTGESRIAEYTPGRDRRGRGGRARAYGRLIIRELKPFIDNQYRTLPEPVATGIGGSSLGGLVSLYLALEYPEVFGNVIVMSPSVWWANRAILRYVRKLPRKPDQRIWLDVGTCEGDRSEMTVKDTLDLRDALVAKGWKLGEDLAFMVDQGAAHEEKAWGRRMRNALKFLFPANSR